MEALLRYPFLFFLPHRFLFLFIYIKLIYTFDSAYSVVPCGKQSTSWEHYTNRARGQHKHILFWAPSGQFSPHGYSFRLRTIQHDSCDARNRFVLYYYIFFPLAESFVRALAYHVCDQSCKVRPSKRFASMTVTDPYHVGVVSGML